MMKNTFYKSKYWIINHVILTIISEIIVLIAMLISINIDNSNPNIVLGFILAFSFVFVVFSLVFLLAPRSFLSKITLTKDTIRWTIFNKTIIEVDWNEITSVKIEYRMYRKCLIFDIAKHIPGFKRNELYFNVDKKNISAVLAHCNNDEICRKLSDFISKKEYKTHYVIWKKN